MTPNGAALPYGHPIPLQPPYGYPFGYAPYAAPPNYFAMQPMAQPAPVFAPSYHGASNLSRYSGTDCVTKILTWINIYELITSGMSDQQRIIGLARNLEGVALQWFREEVIVNIQSLTWLDCRAQMLARFDEAVTSPLLEATKRVHDGTESVAEYHRDKCAKLRLARAGDTDIVGMLTDGMPNRYKSHLITSRVRTPLEWLSVALQLEHNFAQISASSSKPDTKPSRSGNSNVSKSADMDKSRALRDKKKPNKPCQFCKEKFQRDEFIVTVSTRRRSRAVLRPRPQKTRSA